MVLLHFVFLYSLTPQLIFIIFLCRVSIGVCADGKVLFRGGFFYNWELKGWVWVFFLHFF